MPARLADLVASLPAAALAVGLLAFALHLPFAAPVPANWDSVQFALGIERFDLASHQPHPPGYPLYIALGRLLTPLAGDPNAALVWLSLLAGSAAAALLVALGTWWIGSRAGGVAAGTLFAVSPLVWYYSVVGLTYAVEAALTLAVVLLLWRLAEGWGDPGRLAPLSGLLLAVAGGVRPSTLLFLLPLWLYALWRAGVMARGSRRRPLLRGVGALVIGCLLWGAPLLALAGGPAAYLAASARLAAIAGNSSSLLARGPVALAENAAFAGPALGLGLNVVLALVVAWWVPRWRPAWDGARWRFAALWTLPALLFFLGVHIGQAGYLLLVLPVAYLLAGETIARLAAPGGAPGAVPRRAVLLTALPALLSALVFLRSPNDLTAPFLAEHAAFWRGVVAEVRSTDTARGVVLTGPRAWESFRLAGYLLPERDVRALGEAIRPPGAPPAGADTAGGSSADTGAAGPSGSVGELFRGRDHTSTYADFLDGAPAQSTLRFEAPVDTLIVLDESARRLLPGSITCESLPMTERRGIWRCSLPVPTTMSLR